ncbi:MAG: response regulator [Rubrivivax sp.]|nr:response regulator [Rubrivivax sp.]
MRVLYVDDDPVSSLLFVETCRFAGGVEVATAATAAQALELVRHWTPELLVIDLHLPDLDGYQLLPALRSRLNARPPAYLCTADAATVVEGPARAAGFDGCWTKPVDLVAVLAVLAPKGSAAA